MGQALDELVELRGARLRVRTAGHGQAVLFIHGWTLDLDMWTPQFAAFANDYRLIAFDRRGFGFSTGTPGVEQDLTDIAQLLAVLDVERAVIVGMSQGARIALQWALRSPQATSGLVLDGVPADALARSRSESEIPLSAYRGLVRSGGVEAFRRQWLEHPLMRLHTRDTRMHELLRTMISRYPGHDLRAEEADQLDVIGDAARLDVPVLIVNGEHDSAARLNAGSELARQLRGARRAIVPQAGHLPNLDNPGAYNAVLGEFLASEYVPCRAE